MPTVIQLQTPVGRISSFDNLAPAAAEAGATSSPMAFSPLMIRIEDAALRRLVSRDRHLNVLVQCPDIPPALALEEMGDLCDRKAAICLLPGPLELPDKFPGLVLIGDVATLTLQQQIDFYDWLDKFGNSVQVISTTSAALWGLVVRGRFLEGLFYRLNVVSLTAGSIDYSR
jgi:hypothetical protein